MITKKQLYIEAATHAGDWLVRNQVCNILDANNGRFFYCYNLKTSYFEMSTSWQSGMGIISLLWLYKLSGDKKYLKAAEYASSYILSLQVLDSDDPSKFGAFREETPQTEWMHPRDSISAAWGLLSLYQFTDNTRCLKAAQRFADWHIANVWHQGWPVATVNLGPSGLATDHMQVSCQGGSALFFMQLARITGNEIYITKGAKPLLDYYVLHFIEPNGRPHVLYDPVVDDWGIEEELCNNGRLGFQKSWIEMHRYNDDFAGISLLEGYNIIGEKKYLESAKNYASWLCESLNKDGSFGEYSIEVASSSVPLFLMELKKQIADPLYDKAINKSLGHLLSLQISNMNPKVDGGFLGLDNKCQLDPNSWVNIRNTAYSIVALLKAAGCDGVALKCS